MENVELFIRKFPWLVCFVRWLIKIRSLCFRYFLIRKYLKSSNLKKLHLGAGSNIMPGWLNSDILPIKYKEAIYLNAVKTYPFADETFDFVYAEHLIEHFTFYDGRQFLSEIYRVLKPGGVLRIVTPDLGILIDLFQKEKSLVQREYINFYIKNYFPDVAFASECFVLNLQMHEWKHKFLYDKETLLNLIKDSGFINSVLCSYLESGHEVLCNLEFHGRIFGNEEIDEYEVLIIEAQKPSN